MRIYKVWLEIEEHDTETGVHRDLSEEGEVESVPVAVCLSLDEARAWAEALAIDDGRQGNRQLQLRTPIN